MSREKLTWALGPLDPPPDEVEALLFAHRLTLPGAVEEAGLTREELQAIDRTALGAAWTVAETLRPALLQRKKAAKAVAAQQEADGLLQLLQRRSPEDRRDMITVYPCLRTCTLVVRVCDASERAAGHLPSAALELARQVIADVEKVRQIGRASWRDRVCG